MMKESRRIVFLLCGICAVYGFTLAAAMPVRAETILTAGVVRDGTTGRPVAGAVVATENWAVLTDGQGAFRLISEGKRISVRAPGFRPRNLPLSESFDIALEPFRPKALYLSFFGIGEPLLCNPALELIKQTPLNSLVIDIKSDRGTIPFASEVPLARQAGAQRVRTIRDLAKMIRDLKAQNIYLIARIVTFKDPVLAEARPEWGIQDEREHLYRDREGLAWVDPFRPEVWDYNISIAEEAAFYGFDEIQFDYVRFPDHLGLHFADEPLPENRVRAIQNFLGRARNRLQRYNVTVAADIFGYACWDPTDTSIGQRLEDLAPMVDTLAPMLYPSGFENGIGCYRNPVAAPYKIVYLSLQKARERTGLSPLRFRPWLQSFRDYAFDRRRFGAEEIQAQIRAADDFGSDGWMLWNASNVYSSSAIHPEGGCQSNAEILEPSSEDAGERPTLPLIPVEGEDETGKIEKSGGREGNSKG